MDGFDKIKDLLSSQLGISKDKVTMDSDIVKDLGADSLDVVEMLMTLEEEYSITVSEDDAMNIKTVSDIVKLIDKK
jgi:acyl carrier protein